MIPCLFYQTALYGQWSPEMPYNGLGPLTETVSCTVTEERNGEYTLTLRYPSGGGYAKQIEVGGGITAKNGEREGVQMFRIYRVKREMRYITAYAYHISYDLLGFPLPPMSIASGAAVSASFAVAEAFDNQMFPSDCPFSAVCDTSGTASVVVSEPKSLREFIQGSEGSIVDLFGGEVRWDNYTVRLSDARGQVSGAVIYYGKNLTEFCEDISIEDTYTHLYPYAKRIDTTTNLLTGEIETSDPVTVELGNTTAEKVMALQGATITDRKKVFTADLTADFEDGELIIPLNLQTVANRYLANHDLTTPKISYKIKYESREQIQGARYDELGLCDTVTVHMTFYDLDISAKVVKTVYNVLLERFDEIEIGNATKNVTKTLAGTLSNVKKLQAHVFNITHRAQHD